MISDATAIAFISDKRPSNRRAFYYLNPHMLSMSSHISRVASESK